MDVDVASRMALSLTLMSFNTHGADIRPVRCQESFTNDVSLIIESEGKSISGDMQKHV